VARLTLAGFAAWLLFHALVISAWSVVVGAVYFLVVRVRARQLPQVATSFHAGPLLLLLAVALTGLALPATHGRPALVAVAARAHELAVIVLLVGIPFSKLGHALLRPLQLGVRVVQRTGAARRACTVCGSSLAPADQQLAVAELLAARGLHFGVQTSACPPCRRRAVAAAQATALGAHFQPRLVGARPMVALPRDEAA